MWSFCIRYYSHDSSSSSRKTENSKFKNKQILEIVAAWKMNGAKFSLLQSSKIFQSCMCPKGLAHFLSEDYTQCLHIDTR